MYCLDIHIVTSDGTATNFDAMRNSGCTFGTKLDDMDRSFYFDFFDHKLFFVAEVCHMLKLARNALADVKGFVEYEGRQIKWDYIKSLHKIQEEECFKSLHKINLQKVT